MLFPLAKMVPEQDRSQVEVVTGEGVENIMTAGQGC